MKIEKDDLENKHALVGGTFDHFHAGHRKLLHAAFAESKRVTIGVATEALYLHKPHADQIKSYYARERAVRQFLKENNFIDRAIILPLHDIFGISLTDASADAIFVTEETLANAEQINRERRERELPSLRCHVVSTVLSADGNPLSSSRIRSGDIDREGNVYAQLFASDAPLMLPESLRDEVQKPIGKLFSTMQEFISRYPTHCLLIAVGDIVTFSLLQIGKQADISVIDGKTRRQSYESHEQFATDTTQYRVCNKAGTIERESVANLLHAIDSFVQTHKKQLLIVSGEEDLLTIPAILLAPLGSIVLYGQFGQGVVVVQVTEEKKREMGELIGRFNA
jgi:cytidyltransferase-like protein